MRRKHPVANYLARDKDLSHQQIYLMPAKLISFAGRPEYSEAIFKPGIRNSYAPGGDGAARVLSSPFHQEPPFWIAPSAPAEEQQPASIPIRNRILIADEDTLVRGSLTAALEIEGFIVNEAGDGAEAVSLARQWLPDLVLLDIGLPKLEEWTIFGGKGSVRRPFPVIVMTARSHRCHSALSLHLNAFVLKPFGIPTLLRVMKHFTGEVKVPYACQSENPPPGLRGLETAKYGREPSAG